MGDDGGDPARALTLARQFVEQEQVHAFLGTHMVTTEQAITDYVDQKRVPIIGTCNCSAGNDGSPMVFFFGPSATKGLAWSHLAPLATLAQAKTVAFLYCREAPQCSAAAREARTYAPQAGMQVVYEAQVSLAQPDYTAEAISAKNAGAEAVAVFADNQTAMRFIRSAHRQGWQPAVSTQQSGYDERMLKVGESEGLYTSAIVPDLFTDPRLAGYRQAMERIPGGVRATIGASTFVVGQLLEKLAPAFPDDPRSEDFVTALEGLRGETMGGLFPPITFRPGAAHEETNRCVIPAVIHNGKFETPAGDRFVCAPDGRRCSSRPVDTLVAEARAEDAPHLDRRPSLTVLVWGAVGVAWLVIACSGWARWALSDDFVRAPRGTDPISDWHLFWIRVIDWGSAAAGCALAWVALLRPRLRRRGFTPDGMIFLACAVSFFIDPVINQFEYTFAWNAHVFNFGSWSHSVPFYGGPHGYGEGLAWAWAQYLYMGFGASVLGTGIVSGIRRRWAGISNLAAFSALFVLYAAADFVLENVFIRTEVYTYARTWRLFTLWDGSQYQFPIYESLCVATFAVGWTYFRMSWQERGRPFCTGGLERLAVGARTKTVLTFLAVVGFGAAWVFVSYFGPWSWLSVNADSIADLPSYMLPGS